MRIFKAKIEQWKARRAANKERKNQALILWNGIQYFNTERTELVGNRVRWAEWTDKKVYVYEQPSLRERVIKARK